jgi:hypothetical protein
MSCKSCGKPIRPEANTCPACGASQDLERAGGSGPASPKSFRIVYASESTLTVRAQLVLGLLAVPEPAGKPRSPWMTGTLLPRPRYFDLGGSRDVTLFIVPHIGLWEKVISEFGKFRVLVNGRKLHQWDRQSRFFLVVRGGPGAYRFTIEHGLFFRSRLEMEATIPRPGNYDVNMHFYDVNFDRQRADTVFWSPPKALTDAI